MCKLTQQQIGEYCQTHIPYVRNAMFGHYTLCKKGSFKDEKGIIDAAFLGSLIAGRMILEFLGIGLNRSTMQLCRPRKWGDSVWIDDLGGSPINLDELRQDNEKCNVICEYIKLANKAAGHITVSEERPWPNFHAMINLINQLLDNQLHSIQKTS
jgi:hypothetical protein